MTTQEGLFVTGVSAVSGWLALVTVMHAWGSVPIDVVIQSWAAIVVLGVGIAVLVASNTASPDSSG